MDKIFDGSFFIFKDSCTESCQNGFCWRPLNDEIAKMLWLSGVSVKIVIKTRNLSILFQPTN